MANKDNQILLISLGVGAFILLAGGAAVVYYGSTRGYKLHNPFDLEKTEEGKEAWEGEVVPSSDVRFAEFIDDEHGLRAGAITLISYFTKRSIKTLQQVADRFAPRKDKNPADYGARLAGQLGVDKDAEFDWFNRLSDLMKAMIVNEQTEENYPDEMIEAAANTGLTDRGFA